jgi:ABC-type amino acid transport substrate-binding protein|tara:strand:- start:421 stop:600 length:180 start_codon:yes stop_codon:yes gene_type:complete
MHYVREKKKTKTKVSGEIFETQAYGFIVKEESPIREIVNREILKLHETGFYQKLYKKYF